MPGVWLLHLKIEREELEKVPTADNTGLFITLRVAIVSTAKPANKFRQLSFEHIESDLNLSNTAKEGFQCMCNCVLKRFKNCGKHLTLPQFYFMRPSPEQPIGIFDSGIGG